MQPDLFRHCEPKLIIPFGNSLAKLRPVQYVSFIFENARTMICHLNGPMLVETFKNSSVMYIFFSKILEYKVVFLVEFCFKNPYYGSSDFLNGIIDFGLLWVGGLSYCAV